MISFINETGIPGLMKLKMKQSPKKCDEII